MHARIIESQDVVCVQRIVVIYNECDWLFAHFTVAVCGFWLDYHYLLHLDLLENYLIYSLNYLNIRSIQHIFFLRGFGTVFA